MPRKNECDFYWKKNHSGERYTFWVSMSIRKKYKQEKIEYKMMKTHTCEHTHGFAVNFVPIDSLFK